MIRPQQDQKYQLININLQVDFLERIRGKKIPTRIDNLAAQQAYLILTINMMMDSQIVQATTAHTNMKKVVQPKMAFPQVTQKVH